MKTIEQRIDEFKVDLKNESLSEMDIVRKNITYGTPYIYQENEELYYSLKKSISEQFDVNPLEIVMVGSSKLGFSISPKDDKLWKPYNDDSDIDIVIISEILFNQLWKNLLSYNINLMSRTENEDKNYKKFNEYFFKGWIRPDLLPCNYNIRKKWWEYIDSISYKDISIGRKVRIANYKDFHYFESYHIQNIRNLKLKI